MASAPAGPVTKAMVVVSYTPGGHTTGSHGTSGIDYPARVKHSLLLVDPAVSDPRKRVVETILGQWVDDGGPSEEEVLGFFAFRARRRETFELQFDPTGTRIALSSDGKSWRLASLEGWPSEPFYCVHQKVEAPAPGVWGRAPPTPELIRPVLEDPAAHADPARSLKCPEVVGACAEFRAAARLTCAHLPDAALGDALAEGVGQVGWPLDDDRCAAALFEGAPHRVARVAAGLESPAKIRENQGAPARALASAPDFAAQDAIARAFAFEAKAYPKLKSWDRGETACYIRQDLFRALVRSAKQLGAATDETTNAFDRTARGFQCVPHVKSIDRRVEVLGVLGLAAAKKRAHLASLAESCDQPLPEWPTDDVTAPEYPRGTIPCWAKAALQRLSTEPEATAR
jgi:hypothetical protein